jgi:soluble lytic murein transglycosylase-like protein
MLLVIFGLAVVLLLPAPPTHVPHAWGPVASHVPAAAAQPVTVPSAQLEPQNDVEALLFAWADTYQLPRSLALALMGQESGGNPNATSPVGAAGLTQVMPGTAAGIAQELGIERYNIYDPATNVQFGMYYLSRQYQRFGVITWALAAYNWGPGCRSGEGNVCPSGVSGFLERHPEALDMPWEQVVATWGGEIPAETRHYVAVITARAADIEALQK